jgi:hypothetical protein
MSFWTRFRNFLKQLLIVIAIIVVAIVAFSLLVSLLPETVTVFGVAGGSSVLSTLGEGLVYMNLIGADMWMFYSMAIIGCAVGAYLSPDAPDPYDLYTRENGITEPTDDELYTFLISEQATASPVAVQNEAEVAATGKTGSSGALAWVVGAGMFIFFMRRANAVT